MMYLAILTWIKSNWLTVVAVIVTSTIALGAHRLSVYALEDKQRVEIAKQIKSDTDACSTKLEVTKGANDALQKDRDTIAHKLAASKLQHPTTCVSVTGQANFPTSWGGYAGQNGASISSDTLRDYAAEARAYQSQFVICNDFLDKEREIR